MYKVRSVRAVDINEDQHIDLVAAIYGENKIIYLENNGNETFTDYVVDAHFVGAHTIDIKDVNSDGTLDILCSGFDYYYHNGEMIKECFAKLGPYIKSCHGKDVIMGQKALAHLDEIRPGLGRLDYAVYLRELKRIGVLASEKCGREYLVE